MPQFYAICNNIKTLTVFMNSTVTIIIHFAFWLCKVKTVWQKKIVIPMQNQNHTKRIKCLSTDDAREIMIVTWQRTLFSWLNAGTGKCPSFLRFLAHVLTLALTFKTTNETRSVTG